MEPIIDDALVRMLIQTQFPQWSHLPLSQVKPAGSDNAIYRLGDGLSVRLPRGAWAADQAQKENRWLGWLAPQLPLAIPVQLALGVPQFGYPYHWSVARWLDGEPATVAGLTDPEQAAVDVAGFLDALQRVEPAADLTSGGGTLHDRDPAVRAAITAVEGVFDPAALTEVWESALAAPAWDRPSVWFHGDMHNGNVLTVDGRLHAIIDFGGLGVGDPAGDVVIAWTLFTEPGPRDLFRQRLGVDDATWARGRGWAVATGLNAYTSYADTRPDVAENTARQITQALADR